MHRIKLGLAAIAVSGAMQLVAQNVPSRPPAAPQKPHAPAQVLPAKAHSAPETVIDATGLGSPLFLGKSWRVGVTADPEAATPEYDDSAWAIRDAQASFAEVPDVDQSTETAVDPSGKARERYAWYRLHLKLAPNHGPLALLIELPVSQNATISSQTFDLDVFANGHNIRPEGPHGDEPARYQQISRVYNLNLPPNETSLVLVVRSIYIPMGYGAYTTFFASRTLRLGNREDLDHSLELWSVHNLFERLPRLVTAILLVSLALFLLALYFTQKGHIEYLLLALHELFLAPIWFVELAGSFARLDQLWYMAVIVQLALISLYLYFEFLVAFLALPRRWYILLLRFTAPVLACVAPSLLLIGLSRSIWILLVAVVLLSFFWSLGWLVFVLSTLIRATLRRNFEAGLLLVPLLLTLAGWIVPMIAGLNDWEGREVQAPLTFYAGPIPIHLASFADVAGILAIVLIIFVRFLRVQREQEHASSELAAARSVQELMIPQSKLATPGFEVDAVYNPANEVGGDFYHVQPTPGGGLLVVIGDVAGKGLQAAMNVSMLMGALRRTPEQSPAKILQSLNRVLVGSDSFTTCQAIWFGADGALVISSAGHLPPYLNSQEIPMPGTLPLGVLADAKYEEVRLYLHPGDRLLLMSDGVVEARQPSGELFGFDRVYNLSNQSAFYIADAAKEFGQEDDITVLTVRRLAPAVAA
ncbi:MAG: PP2C family protein-serine/threonine phosphatase [Terracidiphilus sp.]